MLTDHQKQIEDWDADFYRRWNEGMRANLDALRADERRKLHWRDRFALWMAKHRRRWERASA